jgi:hypothetical protein
MAVDRKLLVICFVLTGIGVVGAGWAASVSGAASLRYFTECLPFNPSTPECAQLLATMSTYGSIGSVFQAMTVIGIVAIVLLVILDYVQTQPARPPMAAPAYAYAPPPACPRCGRPIRWIPPYGRWYCDAEAAYL